MNTTLFVGNLSFDTTENDLQDLFATTGQVQNVNLIMDRETGRPRGFAFVAMADEQAAQAAIATLHGRTVGGRQITVNEARPREDRPRPSGGGGGGGYRGGGGRGRSGGGGGGYRGERGGGGGGGRDRDRDRGGRDRSRGHRHEYSSE